MVSPSSGDSWLFKSPAMAGLRVLVVDHDHTSLIILEKMLMGCLYEVTKCSKAEIASCLLRDNPEGFDIVISEVHLPDMDGFQLLKKVGLEMDLPLILMSGDSEEMMKIGGKYGACDYLIKPIRIDALRKMSRHALPSRKRKYESDAYPLNTHTEPRVVWTIELHQKFVTAVTQLGIEKASPKRILDMMNVAGLTRENVASHLQKYRMYLLRLRNHNECNLQVEALASMAQIPSQGSFHQKFVSAVDQLGIDKATPEKILNLRSLPGLTAENIASHLGKYRVLNHQTLNLNVQSYGGIGVPVSPFTLPGSSQKIVDEVKASPSKGSKGGDSQDDKPGKDHWIVELDNIVGSSTLGSKRSLFQHQGFSSGDQNHIVMILFGMMCVIFWLWFVFPNLLN